VSDPIRPIPDDLQHLPPSAKYVYHILCHADEPVPRSELLRMTGLPEPTVDRAIDQIRDEGLLDTTREAYDLRHVFYQVDRN